MTNNDGHYNRGVFEILSESDSTIKIEKPGAARWRLQQARCAALERANNDEGERNPQSPKGQVDVTPAQMLVCKVDLVFNVARWSWTRQTHANNGLEEREHFYLRVSVVDVEKKTLKLGTVHLLEAATKEKSLCTFAPRRVG